MFLGKCLRWSLLVWSKALCFGIFGPTAWLATQVKAQSLRLGKQVFVKKNEKSISAESRQYLRYADKFFFLVKLPAMYVTVSFRVCQNIFSRFFLKKKTFWGTIFLKFKSCQVSIQVVKWPSELLAKIWGALQEAKFKKIRFSLIVSSVTLFIQNNLLLSFLSCWIFEIHFEEHLRINYFLRTPLSITNHFNVSYLVLMGYNICISHI